MDNSIHPNNPTYMRLHIERVKEYYDYTGWKGFGLQNDGFDGISVKAGEKYDFSAFMRNFGDAKKVRVALVEQLPGWPPKDPKLLAEAVIDVTDNGWKKYEAVLTPDSTCQKASLMMLVLNVGDLDVDMVSLMPCRSSAKVLALPWRMRGSWWWRRLLEYLSLEDNHRPQGAAQADEEYLGLSPEHESWLFRVLPVLRGPRYGACTHSTCWRELSGCQRRLEHVAYASSGCLSDGSDGRVGS